MEVSQLARQHAMPKEEAEAVVAQIVVVGIELEYAFAGVDNHSQQGTQPVGVGTQLGLAPDTVVGLGIVAVGTPPPDIEAGVQQHIRVEVVARR